jgi:hypothetical protein
VKKNHVSVFPIEMMLMDVMENKEAAIALVLALRNIGLYEAIAKRQNKRIWEAQHRANKAFDHSVQSQRGARTTSSKGALYEAGRSKMDRWFAISNAEAHFYLISWDAVGKLIKFLKSNGHSFSTLDRIWRVHHATFEKYKDARDHLEHWVERLPGENKNTWKVSNMDRHTQFSGNMGRVRVEGVFTFRETDGDKEVDISSASAELLENICSQLRSDLTAEVRSLYANGTKVPDQKNRNRS